MLVKLVLSAAVIAIGASSPIVAAPITLDFSFVGENGANVSGTFYGLDDALSEVQSATSFDLLGTLDTYLRLSPNSSSNNTITKNNTNIFQFSNGDLIKVDFLDERQFPALGLAGDGLLQILKVSDTLAESTELNDAGLPIITGSPDFEIIPQNISPVPLPAGALLLLSGLAGIVGLRRWKKVSA